MSIKKLLSICAIPSLIVGCADLSGTQPPAPVYGAGNGSFQKPAPVTVQQPPKQEPPSSSTVKIQPLKDISTPEVLPIESVPTQSYEVAPPIAESVASEIPHMEIGPKEITQETPPPVESVPTQSYEVAPPIAESVASEIPHMEIGPKEITQETPPPAPTEFTESKAFQPLESVASGSAAVSALVMAANEDSQAGKMDSAVATMERAIRLEPRNPTLLYKLAVLRLQQSKPAQAEDLAKKAALLASKDAQLKKHSWLLIARAREMQHDAAGAQEAREKANSF